MGTVNSKMNMQNQKGQLLVEAVLLMVVMIGLTVFINQQLQERRFFQTLVTGPWTRLQGMVECGVWQPCRGQADLHPNTRARHISTDPRGGN